MTKENIKRCSMLESAHQNCMEYDSTTIDLKLNHQIMNLREKFVKTRESTRLRKSVDHYDSYKSYSKKSTSNARLIDHTTDETFNYQSKFNESNDLENVENMNCKLRSRRNGELKNQSYRSKLDGIFSVNINSTVDNAKATKKRKIEQTGLIENKLKKMASKPKDNVDYLFIEIQFTGFSCKDEIVKLCCYERSSFWIGGFVFPKRKMTIKMSELNKIYVGNRIMTSNDLMCKPKDLHSLLCEFVDLIDAWRSENIVLVYENQFQHSFIPHILINNLHKFDLLQRIETKIRGFIDCSQAFSSDNDTFLLDLSAYQKRIKSCFEINNLFYRLDILQQYFYSRFKAEDAGLNSILKLSEIKLEARRFLSEEKIEDLVEVENAEDTLESLMQQAKDIMETKNCLTQDELRNLYLFQKMQYQYRYSRSYKPLKKAFPKIEPIKKGAKSKLKIQSSGQNDKDKKSVDNASDEQVDESLIRID